MSQYTRGGGGGVTRLPTFLELPLWYFNRHIADIILTEVRVAHFAGWEIFFMLIWHYSAKIDKPDRWSYFHWENCDALFHWEIGGIGFLRKVWMVLSCWEFHKWILHIKVIIVLFHYTGKSDLFKYKYLATFTELHTRYFSLSMPTLSICWIKCNLYTQRNVNLRYHTGAA